MKFILSATVAAVVLAMSADQAAAAKTVRQVSRQLADETASSDRDGKKSGGLASGYGFFINSKLTNGVNHKFIAESWGCTLASINSQMDVYEALVAASLISSTEQAHFREKTRSFVYLGGTRPAFCPEATTATDSFHSRQTADCWAWTDGSEFSDFYNWRSVSPDGPSIEETLENGADPQETGIAFDFGLLPYNEAEGKLGAWVDVPVEEELPALYECEIATFDKAAFQSQFH